ncbi:acyl-CoA dehydrogenase family protein [Natronococcus sp. A-GB1]|uniref:acyl-CoA dehydrogenase family protein n=1 Tax=Natronococcus sp. A-GB1 TaxID=3037648 RepID=UPI00241DF89E|nr:acyl-CoA dehydrogenase family protein [Natronococcus sp. A-GB1]MDG5761142.1 acyl-CoA dehydrogenase family protein [Natronococcus sp. A-GB1]
MELTDEQAAVRDVVREFAREEIRPTALEADRSQEFPEDVWDGLAELDLTSLTVPEAYGGYDADPVTAAVVNEEVAYGALAVATALSVHSLATSCIAEFGSEDLKGRWLPDMADGRPVGAFALSEPHAGSNPAEMSTEASREGDEYVINGEKQWITNGKRAGVYVLFAKTDRDDPSTVTQFLVPGDVDGLSVGEKEDKLGLRASDTTSLTFDDVRIPAENRLTEEGRGLSAAFHILTGGRIAIAAQSVGLAQCAMDEALEYAGEREQFDQPIGEFQSIRHKLAEMATKVKASRLLTREAARERAEGDAGLTASMAKYFASQTAMDVTNEAVQIHGGYGYVTEGEVERLYRDAKITEIYEGTTEIQKKVIARHLLE